MVLIAFKCIFKFLLAVSGSIKLVLSHSIDQSEMLSYLIRECLHQFKDGMAPKIDRKATFPLTAGLCIRFKRFDVNCIVSRRP